LINRRQRRNNFVAGIRDKNTNGRVYADQKKEITASTRTDRELLTLLTVSKELNTGGERREYERD